MKERPVRSEADCAEKNGVQHVGVETRRQAIEAVVDGDERHSDYADYGIHDDSFWFLDDNRNLACIFRKSTLK